MNRRGNLILRPCQRLGLARVISVIHVGSALQGIADAWADVFDADVALEFRLFHELRGLLSRTAEEQRSA